MMYLEAIEAIAMYASIKLEKGLFGKLMDEEIEEGGKQGEIEALDCVTKSVTRRRSSFRRSRITLPWTRRAGESPKTC